MSSLTDIRSIIKDVVETSGVPVAAAMPDRFTPPIAILIPGSPYISEGDTFGSFTVRHEVVVLAGQGENASTVNSLGTLVERAVHSVVEDDLLFLDEVSQPALFSHRGAEYLSCVLSVRVMDRLGA